MKNVRLRAILIIGVGVLTVAAGSFLISNNEIQIFVFKGVSGPSGKSILQSPQPARWQEYDHGGTGRLAVLLTDPDSAWIGVVQGLQSIGVPFRITRDYREALQHRVVLVYPTISGKVLPQEALQALARFPERGSTLIGVNVEGGGLNEVFGFDEAQPSRTRQQIVLDPGNTLTRTLDDPHERVIPFSNNASGANAAGSFGYTGSKDPLAKFEDGAAAITSRQIGEGHAYAFGVDLGFVLLTGYNNREQGVGRSYANDYEPALDVLLGLLRDMYRQGEPGAVTLDAIPQGKALATILTHDIDSGESLANAIEYAKYEASQGIRATYFVQTKYVRDWNDDVFFNDKSKAVLQSLNSLGMEIGSHSVAHSRMFNKMEIGSGDERYPEYRPFVKNQEHTENATILGELRVSRFLIEQFVPNSQITSFRPGHLRSPYSLPQALAATGYRFSSSVTANNSLTHLPFQLTYGRETTALSSIYEFPVTIEDEANPRLGDRIKLALVLADRLSRHGGLVVLLIHPDILDHKLKFEKQFVEAIGKSTWFGTLQEFGEFWVARDHVAVDVERQGSSVRLTLNAPNRLQGLTLRVPAGYHVASVEPRELRFVQDGAKVIIKDVKGSAVFMLKATGTKQ